MSDVSAGVRVLVAQPRPGPGVAEPRTVEALRRLGDDLRIQVVHDARSCVAALRARSVDLVVLDRDLGEEALRVLDALRDAGPPVVVVTREPGPEAALDAFRRGASDCVSAGGDFLELLPAVALEQVRAARVARRRLATGRRIRSLERLHAAIVRQFPAALAVLDADGRLVTVNPAFARAFGVAAEQAAGRPLAQVLPADLLAEGRVLELVGQAGAGAAPAPRRARTRSREGALHAFEVRAEPLDEEGWLLLVLADVSEREQLTRRVRDLQHYTENIIQNMNSALLVVDAAGRVMAGNPPAEQILGVGPSTLRGRSAWDWFPAAPGEAVLRRTLAEGTRFRGAEERLTRDDGARIPIGISCAPLLDAEGATLGAVAIFQDISRIKQLQRQVLQAEKMASIGQLAAGVAHEINNPMGFVHANLFQMEEYLADLRRLWEEVQALQKAVATRNLGDVRTASERLAELGREVDADYLLADFGKAIRESQEGAERIRHIVQDLRAFSHQGSGERVLADVNQCLDSTAHIVWTMMKHCVELRKEYGALPNLRCNPTQLKQVFMNLLVNAYQAIEARIGSEGGTGRVVLRTSAVEKGVVISVADDGVGIPAEHADRIFEPFFTTKEVGVGMGLGLSTSYNIVSSHGGRIRLESQPGRGSRFEVFLPLDGGPEAPGEEAPGEEP